MPNNEVMHKVKGEKMDFSMPKKAMRILPTLRLTDEDLPEIKGWKVGDKYRLVVEVEQTAMRQGDEWQGAGDKDKRVHATFKVTDVGVDDTDKPDDYETVYAEKRSKKKA